MRIENRKRNVQIIVRVTEEERVLIEEKMKQIPTINLSAYSRKMLIGGYITLLDTSEIKWLMEEVWRLERRLLLQFKGLTK